MCQLEELDEREIFWIAELDTYNNGYNNTLGGKGVRGWKADDEFRQKISKLVSGENNPNYNHRWSDEQKKIASERAKKSGIYKGVNNPRAIKIICVETLEVFDYIELAAEKLNIKSSTAITRTLKNKSYVANGYHFVKYDEDIFNYLLNHQYEYLRECYSLSDSSYYYADDVNKVILTKTELYNKIHAESDIKTRDIRKMLSNKVVEFNNIQYKLIN